MIKCDGCGKQSLVTKDISGIDGYCHFLCIECLKKGGYKDILFEIENEKSNFLRKLKFKRLNKGAIVEVIDEVGKITIGKIKRCIEGKYSAYCSSKDIYLVMDIKGKELGGFSENSIRIKR